MKVRGAKERSIMVLPTAVPIPGQIIYLTLADHRLYAEVIQIQSSRHLAWIRPLLLVNVDSILFLATTLMENPVSRLDDPDGPDLLWPLTDICPALDTDLITALVSAHQVNQNLPDRTTQVQALRCFIAELWSNSSRD